MLQAPRRGWGRGHVGHTLPPPPRGSLGSPRHCRCLRPRPLPTPGLSPRCRVRGPRPAPRSPGAPRRPQGWARTASPAPARLPPPQPAVGVCTAAWATPRAVDTQAPRVSGRDRAVLGRTRNSGQNLRFRVSRATRSPVGGSSSCGGTVPARRGPKCSGGRGAAAHRTPAPGPPRTSGPTARGHFSGSRGDRPCPHLPPRPDWAAPTKSARTGEPGFRLLLGAGAPGPGTVPAEPPRPHLSLLLGGRRQGGDSRAGAVRPRGRGSERWNWTGEFRGWPLAPLSLSFPLYDGGRGISAVPHARS